MAERVCPVWVGYFLASPLRKLFQNPGKIVGPYVKKGMKVLDIGSAMGFFSLPLAQMAGINGKVVCVDLQEKMTKALEKRARRAGLQERIVTRLCKQDALGLEDLAEDIDFALAFAVVHEVPDPSGFFLETYRVLKPGAKLLLAEPTGHVTRDDFEKTIALAEKAGFSAVERPRISRSRAVLLEK